LNILEITGRYDLGVARCGQAVADAGLYAERGEERERDGADDDGNDDDDDQQFDQRETRVVVHETPSTT